MASNVKSSSRPRSHLGGRFKLKNRIFSTVMPGVIVRLLIMVARLAPEEAVVVSAGRRWTGAPLLVYHLNLVLIMMLLLLLLLLVVSDSKRRWGLLGC